MPLAMCLLSTVCYEPISVLINIFTLLTWCLLSTLLVLTIRGLCHWPSIAGISPESHCGDEEEEEYERTGLSS